MNIQEVIQEFVAEKGLDPHVLTDIAAEGVLAAYQKKYPHLLLRTRIDQKGGFFVEIAKKVVARPTQDEQEISLTKAKNITRDIVVDETIWVPFDGKIGRVEILKARQIIAQRIREIESKQLYEAFKSKEGEIVVGVVQKHERAGVVVAIGEAQAFLPKTNVIPDENLVVGFTIRALLKEVFEEPLDDHQLILDRSSALFVQRLFELEIPEVFEKIVEIKHIVRAAGYRTKIVVTSRDRNIDPVGTCVGVAGSRIKPILHELHGEKIDVIGWSEALELRVKNALKPAVIDNIELSPDEKTAYVWLSEDQRAVAIGKGGRNITLVAQLTGVNVQLMTSEPAGADATLEHENKEFDNDTHETL